MLKRYLPILPVVFAVLALSGCGPGFPIMTQEQAKYVENVDRLVKENDDLKKRVSALEAGGGEIGSTKNEVEDLKKSLAETNNTIENMHQDLSFVRGSVDEAEHNKDEVKNSINAINEKINALTAGSKDTNGRVDSLKAALDADEKKLTALQDAVASLQKTPAPADSGAAGLTDAETLYARGYKEVQEKNYKKAAETFRGFLQAYPDHKLAVNARYWLGETYYGLGEFERAIVEFDNVVKNHPKGDKAAASMLKEGYSFEKLGSKKEARVLFKEVIEKFPGTPEAGLAKKRLEGIK